MYIIRNIDQLFAFLKHNPIFIYGAGRVAQAFLSTLDSNARANINAVFISEAPERNKFCDFKLMQFKKDRLSKDDYILILISNPFKELIASKLQDIGHDNFAILTDEFCHYQLNKVQVEKSTYNIDGFQMELGEGHTLPEGQKRFPMYDAFVPYLGVLADRVICSDGGWIVDVGANVGDTTAALLRHTQAKVLCVEPTDRYYSLLERNVSAFGIPFTERVRLVKAFVSLHTGDSFVSRVERGTAVNIRTSGQKEADSYTLPDLLIHEDIELQQVALIKTDTDGYDADCLLSFGDKLAKVHPLLYWENQIDNVMQHRMFVQLASYLKSNGYQDFFVFDNFGNYLGHTNAEGLVDIDDYLLRIQQGHSARTIYYVDVLGCKLPQVELCSKIVYDYLDGWK